MPKRSSKPPRDENQAAKRAAGEVARLSGEDDAEGQNDTRADNRDVAARREAAKLLGSLGGKKGGPARARKLGAKRRTEIARRAARARWNQKDKN
jgi:hypothetical protein